MNPAEVKIKAEVDAWVEAWWHDQARIIIRDKNASVRDTADFIAALKRDPEMQKKLNEHILEHMEKEDPDIAARFKASPTKTLKWMNAKLAELESFD
jgi:hypothetical protein